MEVKLIGFTPNPVGNIEQAASMCYDSTPDPNGRIMAQCIKSGHLSVTEHSTFTWEISGVSRTFLAQITRHRLASFSVQSQRYVSYEKGFDYVTPPSIVALGDEAIKRYHSDMEAAQIEYNYWLEQGIKPEDARFILPEATCTKMVVTMNLREFMHFCNERLCTCAQWEIRSVCKAMVKTVNDATDGVLRYYLVPKCEKYKGYPYCTETKRRSCGKHLTLAEIYQKQNDDKKEM